MSAEGPTAPEDGAAAVAAADHWRELEGRTGGAPDTESGPATPQVESGEKKRRKRVLPRRARIATPVALAAIAVALAWIVFGALTGEGSTPRPQSAPEALPTKAHRADQREPSRARWVREPDEGAQRKQMPTPPGAPRLRRRIHPRHQPPRPAPAQPDTPTQPPASGAAPPEPAPEPSEPAPPPPAEPVGKPGLRDGATESAEFGL